MSSTGAVRKHRGMRGTREELEAIWCGEECGLCGKDGSGARMVLDHNPRTGIIRGWLHDNCNKALGLLRDSAQLLRMAADYIDRHDLRTEAV